MCVKSHTNSIQNGKDPRRILLACTVHVYRDPPVGHIAVKGIMICIFDNDLAQVTQEIGIVAAF